MGDNSSDGRSAAGADGVFAAQLDAAMERRSISAAALAERLRLAGTPVARSTLSYWRTGERRPEHTASIEALHHVESILGMHAGAPVDTLAPPRRRGLPAHIRRVQDLFDHGEPARAALERLGLSGAPGFAETTVHHTLDLDAQLVIRTITMRSALRATRDQLDHRPIIVSRADLPPDSCRMTAARGASIGRVVELPGSGVCAAEVVFDRPLRLGETVMTEVTAHLDDPRPWSYWQIPLALRMREASIWVRFDPANVPVTVWAESVIDGDVRHRPVRPDGATTIHHGMYGVGPGMIGLHWGSRRPPSWR